MHTNLDELSPFDMQVYNLALLQKGTLTFTQTKLWIEKVGVLEAQPDGTLQIQQPDQPSRFCRALTKKGGEALAALHWELLTQALDTEERDSEERAASEARKAMFSQMVVGSGIVGGSAQAMQQMQANHNRAIGAIAQNLGMAANPPIADMRAYLAGADSYVKAKLEQKLREDPAEARTYLQHLRKTFGL